MPEFTATYLFTIELNLRKYVCFLWRRIFYPLSIFLKECSQRIAVFFRNVIIHLNLRVSVLYKFLLVILQPYSRLTTKCYAYENQIYN